MSNISLLQSEDPEGWSKGLDDLLKETAESSTINSTASNEKKAHRGRAKGTANKPVAAFATNMEKGQPSQPRNKSMPDYNPTSLSIADFPERATPIKFSEERIPLLKPSRSYNANYNSASSLRQLPNINEQPEESYSNRLRRRRSDTSLRQKVSFHGSVKLTTHNELVSFMYDSSEGGGANDESIFPSFHHHWLPDLYEIEDDTTTAVLSSPPGTSRSRKSKHQQHKRPPPTKRSMRRRMFLFLTEPATSIGSAVFFLFLFVAISVMNLVMIMQTMNRWQYTPTDCISCGG